MLVDIQNPLPGVRATCRKLVPEFGDHEIHVEIEQIKGGITNKLFKCYTDDQTVLCRVYGEHTDLLIDREHELRVIKMFSDVKMGPHFYGSFGNGFIYGYIPGQVQDPSSVKRPMIVEKVARQLRKLHKTDIPRDDKTPHLFPTLRKWTLLAMEKRPVFFADHPSWDILAELDLLESVLSPKGTVVFCHNDLLPGNILENEMDDEVSFIDLEYSNYSFSEFDIANHFCEMAGWEQNLEEDYPSVDLQRSFLRVYADSDDPVVVEDLLQRVELFSLVPHLFWAMWSIVQSSISTIDFDYFGYARKRVANYYALKPCILRKHQEV